MLSSLRHGLAVRIAGSHPAGPGSTPGVGTHFLGHELALLVAFREMGKEWIVGHIVNRL